MVRYMRPRTRFYLAAFLLGSLTSVAFASPMPKWGSAWQQPVPAGGPVSLSHALLSIAPGGQTVVVDLPASVKQAKVSWPAGTREEALQAAVLSADRNGAVSLGEHCSGEFLTVYAQAPELVRARAVGPVPAAGEAAAAPLVATAGAAPAANPSQPPVLAAHVVPKNPAVASSATPSIPKVWLISKGQRMSDALKQWGEAHGWTVVWKAKRMARMWRAPAFAAIPGTFLSAVRLWAHSAIANGAPIRLVEYRANYTLVVESTNGDDNGF